jgi:hypothetical protein
MAFLSPLGPPPQQRHGFPLRFDLAWCLNAWWTY